MSLIKISLRGQNRAGSAKIVQENAVPVQITVKKPVYLEVKAEDIFPLSKRLN